MNKKKMFSVHEEILFYVLAVFVIFFVAGLVYLLGPLIVIGNVIFLALILFFVGICLGFFLKQFFLDLELLLHHHISLWLIVLISSILNFSSMILTFQRFGTQRVFLSSFLMSVVFTVGFLVAFLVKKNIFKNKAVNHFKHSHKIRVKKN